MRESVKCPLCGLLFTKGWHPKDSSTIGAWIQLNAHLNSDHKEAINALLRRATVGKG